MMRFVAAALAMLLAATPALAQNSASPPPGIPVDSRGGQTIDPTKNVLDLVLAAVKRIDDLSEALSKRSDNLREAEAKYQNAMREADLKRLNDLRDAETRRINELAAQKQAFDLELARVIRANQDSSTLLLAAQLKEVKSDSNERTTKLEQFANEQRGRAAAADPGNVLLLQDVKTLLMSRAGTEGKSAGQGDLMGWLAAGFMALVALGGLAVAFSRSHARSA